MKKCVGLTTYGRVTTLKFAITLSKFDNLRNLKLETTYQIETNHAYGYQFGRNSFKTEGILWLYRL